jgi:hypothetical protein
LYHEGKNRAVPGSAPGQIVKLIHRGRSRILRQVTLTYFIAVPLGVIYSLLTIKINLP